MSLVLLGDCCAGSVCGCGPNGDPSKEVLVHCFLVGHGMFFILEAYVALAAFGADRTMGSWEMSIHPFFQSTLGWKAVNQGYPKIAL